MPLFYWAALGGFALLTPGVALLFKGIPMTKNNSTYEVQQTFGENADGLFVKNTQNISQDFLDGLKAERDTSTMQREGEFMKVASVPMAVVEKWQREGFDIMSDKNITAHQILARLRNEHLDGFIATEKKV